MLNQAQPEFSMELLHRRLWQDIRQHRNQLLAEADIKINKLEDIGESASEWRKYRQALRELPDSTDNPNNVVWPKKPD